MSEYEKGTPSWDVGLVLTKHAAGLRPGEKVCALVADLRSTVGHSAEARFARLLDIECDCYANREAIRDATSYTSTKRDA